MQMGRSAPACSMSWVIGVVHLTALQTTRRGCPSTEPCHEGRPEPLPGGSPSSSPLAQTSHSCCIRGTGSLPVRTHPQSRPWQCHRCISLVPPPCAGVALTQTPQPRDSACTDRPNRAVGARTMCQVLKDSWKAGRDKGPLP